VSSSISNCSCSEYYPIQDDETLFSGLEQVTKVDRVSAFLSSIPRVVSISEDVDQKDG
jgi:hypothetical protein